eukprot:Em0009g881a
MYATMQHVTQNQERQKENHDVHKRLHSYQILGKFTAVLVLSTLIVRFDDGTETHYHVDHVKAQIQEGERKSENFQQPGLLPAIATTSDRQPDLPLAPTSPIADVELGPEPLVEAAPAVVDLEAVPLHPTLMLYPSSPIP